MQGGTSESIARDMNLHSAVVLQGPAAIEQRQQKDGGASSSAAGPSMGGLEASVIAQPRQGPRCGAGLEDLREREASTGEELHIRNPRRYFERIAQARENFLSMIERAWLL